MNDDQRDELEELKAEIVRLLVIGDVDGYDFIGGLYGRQRIGPVPRIVAVLNAEKASWSS